MTFYILDNQPYKNLYYGKIVYFV